MEKQRRTSVEKAIDNNYFRLKLGTVNRSNPEVVYLEGKTFIIPLISDKNHKNTLQIMRKRFYNIINNVLINNDFFENKFILDLQVANSGIKVNKKSFLIFQLLLRQKRDSVKELKVLKNEAFDTLSEIINNFSECILSNDFALAKTKKETIYC